MTRAICLIVFCLGVALVSCAGELIRIGGIFDNDNDDQEIAFKHVAEYINHDRILSPHQLLAVKEKVSPDNDFQVSQTVCSLLSSGAIAILGPNSRSSSEYVQSLCDTKEVPHLDTTWNNKQKRGSSLVNLYPYPPVLAKVFAEIVKMFDWKSFAILYENEYNLAKVSELFKMHDSRFNGEKMSIWQLDEHKTGDYRPVLINLKKSGETYFVLECSIEILPEVLKQALQVGLMSDKHSYVITNLDLHTLDLFPFQHGGSNITGVQLIDPDNPMVVKVAKGLQHLKLQLKPNLHPDPNPEWRLRTETALIYDAVYLFAESFKHIASPGTIESKGITCNSTNSWRHGSSMMNYLKTRAIQKLSGNVKFDYEGFRSDFMLNIIELGSNGLKKIGTWNSTEGLNISRITNDASIFGDEGSLQNKSFVVLIALSDPYNMLKEASQKLTGNDRFEGYGIDLIHELSLLLGFNYTFKLQEDGQYGSRDLKTGEWNGMIRELRDYRADLAITDLTITSERESAVDFTMPFMNLGISILYKKPMKLPPSLFSFMSPFSEEVWYYLGGAYIGVSIMLYIMARISPAEWTNRFPCVDDPEFLENQFSLRNSFWFTIGSLMQQGSEIAPIAISTRMVAGTWWFFTLIMVSSYTANLAAFLTVESLSSPFKTIHELANQGVIKYGAKSGGSTANFFRDSNHTTYQKIWRYMGSNPEVMTDSNPNGVKRAETEDYAFFMESTTIEYTIQRYCNLTQIGGLLDDKGYGIAMRKNSPYRNILSTAVLKLQETGKLTSLKIKWWKEKRGGGACHSDVGSGDAQELDLANVGGVFFVLVVGSASGFLVGTLEVLIHALKLSFQNGTPFREELSREVKFLLQLRNRTKPLVKKQLTPPRQPPRYPESFDYVPEYNKNALN